MASARHNRKRRRNRGRLGLLFKLLCLAALAAAIVFGATVFFQVETIAVSGNNRYTQEEIITASGVQIGDNLFRMNKGEIAQRIRESLPYVGAATVQRRLPSTLIIQVEEWDAVGRVEVYTESQQTQETQEDATAQEGDTAQEDAGETEEEKSTVWTADTPWLINVSGKLLEQPQEGSQEGISITGLTILAPQAGTPMAVPQDQQGKLDALLRLLDALEEQQGFSRVSSIDVTRASWMELRYDGRFTVRMPMTGDTAKYLNILNKVVENHNQTQGETFTGTIDLTQEQYDAVVTPDPTA